MNFKVAYYYLVILAITNLTLIVLLLIPLLKFNEGFLLLREALSWIMIFMIYDDFAPKIPIKSTLILYMPGASEILGVKINSNVIGLNIANEGNTFF
jgi:Zn-dependent protease